MTDLPELGTSPVSQIGKMSIISPSTSQDLPYHEPQASKKNEVFGSESADNQHQAVQTLEYEHGEWLSQLIVDAMEGVLRLKCPWTGRREYLGVCRYPGMDCRRCSFYVTWPVQT